MASLAGHLGAVTFRLMSDGSKAATPRATGDSTSENLIQAKFAECIFPDIRWMIQSRWRRGAEARPFQAATWQQ